MSQAPSVAVAAVGSDSRGAGAAGELVSLKGTTRGLEIMISGATSVAALETRLTELLAEAPSFFAGCDARVVFAAPLPSGALACLEDVARRFQLTIVEIGPAGTKRSGAMRRAGDAKRAERTALAEGTGATRPTEAAAAEATDRGAGA